MLARRFHYGTLSGDEDPEASCKPVENDGRQSVLSYSISGDSLGYLTYTFAWRCAYTVGK